MIDDSLVSAPQREVRASVLLAQADAKPGHVLVRDHGGEEDVAIAPDELVKAGLQEITAQTLPQVPNDPALRERQLQEFELIKQGF